MVNNTDPNTTPKGWLGRLIIFFIACYLGITFLFNGILRLATSTIIVGVAYSAVGLVFLIIAALLYLKWKLKPSITTDLYGALGISSDKRMHARLLLLFLGVGFLIFGLLLWSSGAGIILISLGALALVVRFTFLRK